MVCIFWVNMSIYGKSSNISCTKAQDHNCFWFRLAVVFAQSIEAKCWVENEDVIGAAHTGDTPTYGGVEGPPHVFFNIMLSHTDDLVTRPYDKRAVAISYEWLTNSYGDLLTHMDDLLTRSCDITLIVMSCGRLNISPVWHSNSIPISNRWLTNSSVWQNHCCYVIRMT